MSAIRFRHIQSRTLTNETEEIEQGDSGHNHEIDLSPQLGLSLLVELHQRMAVSVTTLGRLLCSASPTWHSLIGGDVSSLCHVVHDSMLGGSGGDMRLLVVDGVGRRHDSASALQQQTPAVVWGKLGLGKNEEDCGEME